MSNENDKAIAVKEIDAALMQDARATVEKEAPEPEVSNDILPKVMRTTGAITIIASAITFMAQGWSEWTMVIRHFAFLGVTASLTAGGIIAGIKVREDKGARTFLTLALAMIPVHFTQMGGMVHSLFGKAPAGMPDFFIFIAPSGWTVLLVTAVTVPMTAVVAYMGYSVLARPHAGWLTGLYAIGNAFFLIPLRDQWAVMGMAVALSVIIVIFDRKVLHPDPTTHNLEGGLVRFSLFTPVLLLLFRNLYYSPDAFFVAVIFGVIGTVFYRLVPAYIGQKGKLASSMQVVGALNYLMAGGFLAHGIVDNGSVKVTVAACVLALVTVKASEKTAYVRVIAALMLGVGVLYSLFETIFDPSIWVATCHLVASIGILSIGLYRKEAFPTVFSIVCALVSLANLGYQAVVRLNVDVWVSLAAIGLIILSAAIYLEKSGKLRLKRPWSSPDPKEVAESLKVPA